MYESIISEKERLVFETLSRLGPNPVSKIAKDIGLNRTALYHTLNLLIEKGLVFEIKKNETTIFQALAKKDLEIWLDRRFSMLKKDADEFMNNIKYRESPTLHSGIRYFEGMEAVKKLYNETWIENKDKNILAITDYKRGYETMNDFFEYEYFPFRVKAGVTVKSLLTLDSYGKRDVPRAKELLRDMRFSNIFKDLGIEINIFDDKLAIVAFDEKNPMGMILRNKLISEAFRKIFDFLWKSSRQK